MIARSSRDDESVVALDDQRRALVIAYTSHLLVRSHRAELTTAESSAIARCTTLAEAMRVIEKRRTPLLAGAINVEPASDGEVRRRLAPLARLLREVVPYFPMMWIGR